MFATQIASAIEDARSLHRLNDLSGTIWKGLAAGALTDENAQRFAEQIHARKLAIKAAAEAVDGHSGSRGTFPTRKPQRPPLRSVAIERRRRLASSGPLPPSVACRFTVGELAVLRIVGDEVRQHGQCDRCVDEMAARAGVCRSMVKNAIRTAARLAHGRGAPSGRPSQPAECRQDRLERVDELAGQERAVKPPCG